MTQPELSSIRFKNDKFAHVALITTYEQLGKGLLIKKQGDKYVVKQLTENDINEF